MPLPDNVFWILYSFNALSFLGYGIACISTQYMVSEFERYRLPQLRVFAGVMQILSALILVVGFKVVEALFLGAGLIVLMMAFGVIVRARIGDSLVKMFPAIFYLILNILLLASILN